MSEDTIIHVIEQYGKAFIFTSEEDRIEQLLNHSEFEVDGEKSIERDGSFLSIYGDMPIDSLNEIRRIE